MLNHKVWVKNVSTQLAVGEAWHDPDQWGLIGWKQAGWLKGGPSLSALKARAFTEVTGG